MLLTGTINGVMARGVRFLLGFRLYPFLRKTGPGVPVFGYCSIRYVSVQPDAPGATCYSSSRSKATGRVSMSTRPDLIPKDRVR